MLQNLKNKIAVRLDDLGPNATSEQLQAIDELFIMNASRICILLNREAYISIETDSIANRHTLHKNVGDLYNA